jgi:hypothetical protein
MKRISLGYFLITMFSHAINGMNNIPNTVRKELMSTKKGQKKILIQIAFASICEKTKINPNEKKLIESGLIDLDFPYGSFGRTQLSMAACCKETLSGPIYNDEMIELLLKNKANPNSIDSTGRDAALWSTISFQGANEHPITHFIKHPGFKIDRVYEITDIGSDLQQYEPKVTLLTAAVLNTWFGQGGYDYRPAWYNLVKILLKAGADRNLTPNGRTALQIAEELKDEEMIKMLKDQ